MALSLIRDPGDLQSKQERLQGGHTNSAAGGRAGRERGRREGSGRAGDSGNKDRAEHG